MEKLKNFFSYKNIKEWINTIVFALFFAFLFQTLLYQPFQIPSGSMKPGLQIWDYLFVKKFEYGYNNSSLSFMLNRFNLFSQEILFSKPKRGDVIVFLSNDNKTYYIKRVIGLPRDEVQIIDGKAYINGKKVLRVYEGKTVDVNSKGHDMMRYIYKETLDNGVSYKTYMTEGAQFEDHNNTLIYKVPEDSYFVMGDNRDESGDSRFRSMGYIKLKKIVGKAQFLLFASNLSRAFKVIK